LVFKGILKTEWGSEAGALPSHSVGKVGATACGCACFVHKGIQHVYLLNERGEASPRCVRIRGHCCFMFFIEINRNYFEFKYLQIKKPAPKF